MTETLDWVFMARALRLAERGRYTTDPNPRVGCVLVHDGQVVGEGFHRKAGEPHAERNALAEAGDRARGATAYVTLEPCSHYGRTPPCADGLIEAGVGRVVVAMEDPNPQVSGRGLTALRKAGIVVESGLLEAQARALNPGFIKRMEQGLPFVRAKLAMSLDGRTAMANGESQWITGPAARAEVQRGRAASSVVVTGIGTVLADDPSMNIRLAVDELHDLGPDYPVRQPVRVVLDPTLVLPPDAKILRQPGQVLLFCAQADPQKRVVLELQGAQIEQVDAEGDRLDLLQVFRRLAALGMNEIWLETGPTLAGAALQAGLVDELQVYMAPLLLGDQARPLCILPGLEQMSDRLELNLTEVRHFGQDLRLIYTPQGR